MGSANSSPRKVTVSNPNEASIIKITENVVDRLQEANRQENAGRPKADTASGPSDRKETTDFRVSGSSVAGEAIFITSHQIRSEINREIEKNNTYWESRLKVLRDGYRKINAELEDEYNKAVKEVNQSLGEQYLSGNKTDLETCKQSKSSVIECYNTNKNKPLLCSAEVQKFNECVSNKMNTLLRVK